MCFDDERTAATDALYDRLTGAAIPAAVPAIWPFEVANTLALAVRRGRIEVARRADFIRLLGVAPVTVEPVDAQAVFDRVVALADATRLTVYDAAYLELAQRLAIPLATLDRELAAAARANGVALLL